MLAKALQSGEGLLEFHQELKEELQHTEDVFHTVDQDSTPTRHLTAYLETLRKVGLKHFSKRSEICDQRKPETEETLKLIRERAKLRERGDYDGSLCERILALTKDLKMLAKRQWKAFTHRLDFDIVVAWKDRRFAQVYRLAHLRAGKRRGVRRRDYRALPSA